MNIKTLGGIIIITASWYVSHLITTHHSKSVQAITQLIEALETMEYELQYRFTPLPDVLNRVATRKGLVKDFFCLLSLELGQNIETSASVCVKNALAKISDIPSPVAVLIEKFGNCIGKFDIDSQILSLRTIRKECEKTLLRLTDNQDIRLRNYCTYALCIGATLVIILL